MSAPLGSADGQQAYPEPGPVDAVPSSDPIAPGSVRRTSTVDMRRPDGFDGMITADIRGRDLRRSDGGDDTVLDEVHVTASIEEWSGRLRHVEGSDHPGLTAMVGSSVRRGYGRVLVGAFADDLARRTLLASILEDFGGAMLVSGYAPLRRGLLAATPEEGAQRAGSQQDICAGWASGGPLVELLRTTGASAVPRGPRSPALTTSEGWHDTVPPGMDSVTRIRSLDVGRSSDGAGSWDVRAHFRDSYNGDAGPMTMHEYVVRARVSGTEPAIEHIEVEPRVLPWSECPSASPSATRVIGTAVADLPAQVRAELVGTSTCTHLNSTLRSLADVGRLIEEEQR